ncbi:MAG: hypothetical protein H5T69_01235 [Chloroflexi bacterium]|nr:hypothetical protein [Chloroflexota bacterium]
MEGLYPLRFREILRNYGFGGRWIAEAFAKEGLSDDHRLAETWEAVDRPGESSIVRNGPLAGHTLHQLIEGYGQALLGSEIVARFGARFPLLIKFLDATHPLGEQIHPDDEQARSMGSFDTGKTEAWYMLGVRAGATIHAGPRAGLTREELVEALLRRESRACMREYEPQPGEAFLLYAGTMHYSRGGMLFCEIMQNSDITIGLNHFMDRAEPGRERERAQELSDMIHIEEDFDCRTRQVVLAEGRNRRTYVLACRHFAMERLDLAEPEDVLLEGRRFVVLAAIEGACRVAGGAGAEVLRPGQTCLLPASLGAVSLEPKRIASLLSMYVPDLKLDIIEPLRAQGVSADEILGLGGQTALNDLRPLL